MPVGIALNPIAIQRNKNYRFDGAASYINLMEKWGFSPTLGNKYLQGTTSEGGGAAGAGGRQSRVRKVQKRVGNSVEDITADDVQSDSLYQCEVWLGTPPQKFFFDIDTASADTWVWANTLPGDVISRVGSKHVIYDPTKSSTFKETEGKWEITYGNRVYASGTVGTDNMTLGGMQLFDQPIQLANYLCKDFVQDKASDGALGLAHQTLNTVKPTPVKSPLESMLTKDHSQIHEKQRLFTMRLGDWKREKDRDHNDGYFTFGFVDYDLVAESKQVLHYAPIDNSTGLWQFKSNSFLLNGQTVQRSDKSDAIVDTGCPLVLVDDACCKAIYDAIPGSKFDEEVMGFVFPANIGETDLPSVGFEIDGKLYVMDKEDLGFSVTNDKQFIYGSIQSRGNMTLDIFGDAFLKSVYMIFDLAHDRIGVVSRPAFKQDVETLPGHDPAEKQGFFHRLIHRVNHGKEGGHRDQDTGKPMAEPVPQAALHTA